MMDPLPVQALAGKLRTSIRVPGSKSLTNRALILATLAEGTSVLDGVLRSDDTDAVIEAIRTLGAEVTVEGQRVSVTGTRRLRPDRGDIDLGAGGTPARFILALASLAEGPVVLDGSPRLRERPMQELVEMLSERGATLEPLGRPGFLPIRVHPGTLAGGSLRVNAQASSQFVSALLLIASRLPGGLAITFESPPTSESYLRLTLREMKAWGVEPTVIEDAAGALSSIVVPEATILARYRRIPADASSALYWAALATILSRVEIDLPGLDPADGQPDHGALAALGRIGLELETGPDGVRCRGTGAVRGWGDLEASSFPDGAMALAVVAACGTEPTRLSGLQTLRVKECDRVAALHQELRKIGTDVTIEGDDLIIAPPGAHQTTSVPCDIETYDDHRMAMAFAIMGLRRGGLSICDPGCVDKSYPGFWSDLHRVQAAAGGGTGPSR